jgi:hypothetical protein
MLTKGLTERFSTTFQRIFNGFSTAQPILQLNLSIPSWEKLQKSPLQKTRNKGYKKKGYQHREGKSTRERARARAREREIKREVKERRQARREVGMLHDGCLSIQITMLLVIEIFSIYRARQSVQPLGTSSA